MTAMTLPVNLGLSDSLRLQAGSYKDSYNMIEKKLNP